MEIIYKWLMVISFINTIGFLRIIWVLKDILKELKGSDKE